MYVKELGRKYSGLKPDMAAQKASRRQSLPRWRDGSRCFTTSEGPVVITTRDRVVFVAESFPLDVARKLTELILDAQGTGELKMAEARPRMGEPSLRLVSGARVGDREARETAQPLTADLVRACSPTAG